METRYRVTGIRKADKSAQVITFHDTDTQAQWWLINHMAEENNAHVYQVAELVDGRCEYAWYAVDGRRVAEYEWSRALGLKTQEEPPRLEAIRKIVAEMELKTEV